MYQQNLAQNGFSLILDVLQLIEVCTDLDETCVVFIVFCHLNVIFRTLADDKLHWVLQTHTSFYDLDASSIL